VLDFPADGQLIVTMYAGDCDILAANRRVTYSLSDVQFAFIDDGRGYELDERADERAATAFAVDAASGAVTPTLASYRPYSFGRFVLTVQATDSSGRRDASELKVGIACIYLFSYLRDSQYATVRRAVRILKTVEASTTALNTNTG